MDNSKYDIDKLVGSLPQFEPDEGFWEQIEGNLDFQNKLSSALKELPTFEPDASTWQEIDSQLDFNSQLDSQLDILPQFDPDLSFWSKVENDLDTKNKKSARQLFINLNRLTMPIAASMALLIGLWYVFNWNSSTETISVTYAEESLANNSENIKLLKAEPLEREALAFINASCLEALPVCNTDEFKSLKTQLDDLELEMGEINEMISMIGEDAELVAAAEKVRSLQADVTKALIDMLI